MINKKLALIFTVFILTFALASCGKNNETKNNLQKTVSTEVKGKNTSKESSTRTIVDHAGNSVEIPNKIEKIVIDQIPILSTYMAYHEGSTPYIVGYAGSLKEVISDTVLKDIAPELLDATNTVQAQSDLNVEEIMKLKPDVIFYNANNKQHYEILSKTGIPCIGFATVGGTTPADPINRYAEWLHLLEDVFGEKGKMNKFIADGQKIIDEVEEKIGEIPENERPTAMILWKYTQGIPTVSGKGVFGEFWLQRLGVKNVAIETKGFAKVNFEEIYRWNPDILYLDGPGLMNLTSQQVINNEVDGANFYPIKAVQNKRVYNSKLGMWNWFTPNPDAPLVLAWLAQKTYPEKFKDYPLKEKIKEYYKTWYKYDLNQEDIEEMFNI